MIDKKKSKLILKKFRKYSFNFSSLDNLKLRSKKKKKKNVVLLLNK